MMPHDAAYKQIFSHLRPVKDLLRYVGAHFPPDVHRFVGKLDLSELRTGNAEVVD